jgi:hypothetical protein
MALTENTFVDQVTFLPESGHTQVREATVVYRDGEEVSRTYHRHVVEPTTTDLSGEMRLVRRIIRAARRGDD